MNPLIRRATIDDLERLLPLVGAYREFYEQPRDAVAEQTFIYDHLSDGTSVIFLALDDDGAAVGFAQLFETYSTVHLSKTIVFEDLYVVERARRNGTATALLEAANEYARECGATQMFLETAMDNTAAQRVYERNGWTREARFYKYNASLRSD